MRGHNICFIEEILKIIPELSLLLLLIWSLNVTLIYEERQGTLLGLLWYVWQKMASVAIRHHGGQIEWVV